MRKVLKIGAEGSLVKISWDTPDSQGSVFRCADEEAAKFAVDRIVEAVLSGFASINRIREAHGFPPIETPELILSSAERLSMLVGDQCEALARAQLARAQEMAAKPMVELKGGRIAFGPQPGEPTESKLVEQYPPPGPFYPPPTAEKLEEVRIAMGGEAPADDNLFKQVLRNGRPGVGDPCPSAELLAYEEAAIHAGWKPPVGWNKPHPPRGPDVTELPTETRPHRWQPTKAGRVCSECSVGDWDPRAHAGPCPGDRRWPGGEQAAIDKAINGVSKKAKNLQIRSEVLAKLAEAAATNDDILDAIDRTKAGNLDAEGLLDVIRKSTNAAERKWLTRIVADSWRREQTEELPRYERVTEPMKLDVDAVARGEVPWGDTQLPSGTKPVEHPVDLRFKADVKEDVDRQLEVVAKHEPALFGVKADPENVLDGIPEGYCLDDGQGLLIKIEHPEWKRAYCTKCRKLAVCEVQNEGELDEAWLCQECGESDSGDLDGGFKKESSSSPDTLGIKIGTGHLPDSGRPTHCRRCSTRFVVGGYATESPCPGDAYDLVPPGENRQRFDLDEIWSQDEGCWHQRRGTRILCTLWDGEIYRRPKKAQARRPETEE